MNQAPHDSRRVYAGVAFAILLWALAGRTRPAHAQQSSAPGGFVESAASLAVRPLLTQTQLQTFLPSRGPFTFPAPYLTEGVRLTNASDCADGADCVNGVGYSYWRNINNHVGSDTMYIVLGLDRQRGGLGPTLFSYNKVTGDTRNLGPLFDSSSPFSWVTGEDAYFSATIPTALYITTVGRAQWFRYDVVSRTFDMVFDASTHFGSNVYIWQVHTSNDDAVHSFTLRDSTTDAMKGCGAYRESTKQWYYFPARGDFDECQIDKSGRWLLIKENLGLGSSGDDNVVEDLQTGSEQILMDQNGAPGHSDNGFGYMVGEDNFFQLPGAVRIWNFGLPFTDPSQGKPVFYATSWAWGSNHIAHSNAQQNTALGQQWACSSDANRLNLPRANEVLCYRLDGSFSVLVVAPVMTNLDASGGGTDEYWKLPKGNLDVTGQYFIWTTNLGGNRLDAFIVHVPVSALPPAIDGSNPPNASTDGADGAVSSFAPASAATPAGAAPVAWSNIVNATVSGDVLQKSGGCDGCPDAGAVSTQQITSGDGYLEFTAAETKTLRFVGLSRGNAGTAGTAIDFAFRLQNGIADVREGGLYRADVPIVANDVLRVQVSGGTVSYEKNGTTFYTSAKTPAYPLAGAAALYDAGTAVTQAVMATGSSSSGSSSGSLTTPAPVGGGTTTSGSLPAEVLWTDLVNTSATGSALTKTSGCDGCPDAGAVSAETITGGDGYVDIVAPSNGLFLAGLGSSTAPENGSAIDFALRFANNDTEVREHGIYRTDVPTTPGDRFRVAIIGGQVIYSRNGTPFYTSTAAPAYPMHLAATLFTLGSSLPAPTVSGN